ncbi:MAG TPA: hypothetical protein PLD48_06575 [Bacillota bacterium]|nr:hypothetical protein [Bacillota bacterium]HOK69012.1 hypothetical protein [Bacillota bacterium]HPP85779.1 hypothetical protein [Bacillota bacterium]
MPKFTDAGLLGNINDLLDNLIDVPNSLKEQNIPPNELYCEAFMKKYTDAATFAEFLRLGGFKAETSADLDAIPVSELDKLTAEHTQFDAWREMQEAAAKFYLEKN